MKNNHIATWNSTIQCMEWARKKGGLLLGPPYQRPYCWTEWQQEALIDSILRVPQIPLPAIFVRDYSQGINFDIEVVDGKQRLTTIFNYIDGLFIPKNNPAFKDLNDWRFMRTGILVYKLTDFTDDQVFEIYNRLNFNGTPHKESERAV